ncbi:MAG TPA: hypothetical protein VNM48_05090 [Chloroflexota bacterium]|nr:hypothetical protein [Chloroflexota bacterium]
MRLATQALTPAAARRFVHPVFGRDQEDYYYAGGSPVVLVEQGVPPGAPIDAPGFARA